MAAYVILFNYTEQGIKNIKETGNRAKAAASALKGMGGRFIGIWWLIGQYDGVVILEAPDDQTVMRFLAATGMQGNIRTNSMRAFGEEEIGAILSGLP
jgi:uncharacterized protein with GYD domain